MPVIRSAEKQARQSLRNHKRNLHLKRRVKKEVKTLLAALAKDDKTAVVKALQAAQSAIDKTAKNGIVHKNKAAHQKSKLAKLASGNKPKTEAKPAEAKTKAPVKKVATKKPAAKK